MTAHSLPASFDYIQRDPEMMTRDELVDEVLLMRWNLDLLKSDVSPAVEYALAHKLTPAEARIFVYLCAAKGGLRSQARIHEAIYNDMPETPDVKIVDVLICKIRKKLTTPDDGLSIVTVWGYGYRLVGHIPSAKPTLNIKPIPEPTAEVA